MKNYVVGFLNFFDNELKLEKVQAQNEVEALKNSSFIKEWLFPEDVNDVETIQSLAFDCDSAISVIEV